MANNNHVDYLESLFQGIDILIDRRLQDVSYDTTILCTIVDDSNSKNGKYVVTDGAIRFDAYSDSDKYKKDDKVRVSVAKGDYTDTKYIVGKDVSSNSSTPLTYVSPLDTVVNISDNLIPSAKQSIGIIANNKEGIKEKLIWKSLSTDTNNPFKEIMASDIYSTISLRADFKTLLHSHNVKSGSFGLHIEFLIKPNKESTGYVSKHGYLDSSEMFGDPYAFIISTEQAKLFDIGSNGIIAGIALALYQDGEFKDYNGEHIPADLADNIIVSNIELGLGSNLISIGDNTLKAYTDSSHFYNYQGHDRTVYQGGYTIPNNFYTEGDNSVKLNSETNLKQLGLIWYNKNENNEYVGFGDGVYDADYDEITYIEKTRVNTRLMNQKGREGIPTNKNGLILAADIEEAVPNLRAAARVVTRDIVTSLSTFKDQCPPLDTNIETAEATISGINFDTAIDNLEKYYKDVLACGVEAQARKTGIGISWPEDKGYFDKFNEDTGVFKIVRATISSLLAISLPDGQGGYQGNLDIYNTHLNRLIEEMHKHLALVPTAVLSNSSIEAFKSGIGDAWQEYDIPVFPEDDNKYCIYWYRYDGESEVDAFMPKGWARIGKAPLPAEDIDTNDGDKVIKGHPGFYKKRLAPGGDIVRVWVAHDKPEEKFVAVLFYNHVMYKSDEIVFTNVDRIPEEATLETGDLLLIEHGDRSRADYQIYNLTNHIQDIADSSHQRRLRVHYDGLLHGDEALNGGLYWYIPNVTTMLTYDIDFLLSKGFSTDEGMAEKDLPPYSKSGYTCFYRRIETKDFDSGTDPRDFWYKIKPYYEATSNINTIKCEFIPDAADKTIYGEELFSFGIAGTSGTKYTLAITSKSARVAVTPSVGMEYNVLLKNQNNENEDIPEFDCEWMFLKKGASYAPLGDKDISTTQDPDIITTPKDIYGILKVSTGIQIESGKDIQEEEGREQPTRFVELEIAHAVPWTSDDNYYISGPTSIIYNTLGTIDNNSMFDNPYRLYKLNTNEEQIDVEWSIEYHKADGSLETNTKIQSYMPQLDSTNRLIPATLYLDGLGEECFAVVCAKQEDGNYLYRQPIIILQNRYGSPILNSWDGSLTIDEKNNIILSAMVGAGRKNSDNSFSGVLMGDVAGTGEMDHTGLGLYGFHKGAQSFGFNVNGTAFLGKSGKGRIIFNGNNGVIASANWFTGLREEDGSYPNGGVINSEGKIQKMSNDGMCIDLDSGHIDAYNFKLTSAGVQLNSNPVGEEKFVDIGNDRGKLTLSKDGELAIDVDRFTLTNNQVLGSNNLLHQTNPQKTHAIKDATTGVIAYDWELSKWVVTDQSTLTADKYNPEDINVEDNNYIKVIPYQNKLLIVGGISQEVNVKPNTNYTLSGQVKFNYTTSISIATKAGDIIKEVKVNMNEDNLDWIPFAFTFNTGVNNKIDVRFINTKALPGIESEVSINIYHAQLEEGTIQTGWKPSIWDTNNAITVSKNNYDLYLDQDQIFNKLVTDPITGEQMVGIWMNPVTEDGVRRNELYISASYISTGVLRSTNWNGTLGKAPTLDDDNQQVIDSDGNPLYHYIVIEQPTRGTYWNLDTGHLWAADFHLVAGNSLILNSNPKNNQAYLYVGDDNNYISFKKIINEDESESVSLAITSDIFTLTAEGQYIEDDDKIVTGIIAINSHAETYPLSIGNRFKVKWDGSLEATNVDLSGKITAGSGSKIAGWKITDSSISSSITLNNGDTYYIGLHDSWPDKNTIAVNGVSSNKWRIIAGKQVTGGYDGFGITRDGAIYANSGKIGPLEISNDGLGIKNEEGITDINTSANAEKTFISSSLLQGSQAWIDRLRIGKYDQLCLGGTVPFNHLMHWIYSMDSESQLTGYIAFSTNSLLYCDSDNNSKTKKSIDWKTLIEGGGTGLSINREHPVPKESEYDDYGHYEYCSFTVNSEGNPIPGPGFGHLVQFGHQIYMDYGLVYIHEDGIGGQVVLRIPLSSIMTINVTNWWWGEAPSVTIKGTEKLGSRTYTLVEIQWHGGNTPKGFYYMALGGL